MGSRLAAACCSLHTDTSCQASAWCPAWLSEVMSHCAALLSNASAETSSEEHQTPSGAAGLGRGKTERHTYKEVLWAAGGRSPLLPSLVEHAGQRWHDRQANCSPGQADLLISKGLFTAFHSCRGSFFPKDHSFSLVQLRAACQNPDFPALGQAPPQS